MFNKKLHMIFIVLFILLVGLSVASATDTNNTKTQEVKDTVNTVKTTEKTSATVKDNTDNVTKTDIIKTERLQDVKSASKSIEKSVNSQSKGEDNLLDFALYTSDIECDYGDYVDIDVTTVPEVHEGVLSWFINGRLVGVKNLSNSPPTYTLRTASYMPNTYTIMVSYSSSLIYINNQTTASLTIRKLNTSFTNLDYGFNDNNNIDFSLNILDSKNNLIDYGYLNVYNGSDKIREIEIEDVDVLFTLPGIYNTETLRFELEEDDYYNSNNTYQLIDLPLKDLNISTNRNITAHVGDMVSVPFTFNESVNDGKVSISYGGSPDNIISVTGGVNSIIFDTTGYLQGEYELVIRYYDGHIFTSNSTQITLYLYQPTTLTADKDEIDVVLGEGNSYSIDFETSLDSWGDIIWGSIDVYIDNKIIDTLIIDDTTANQATLILDDYNMEKLTPTTHTLTAIFNTDDEYIETSTTTVTLNIEGTVELILPDNITVMTSDSIVIPVNATFNNKRLTSGVLSFYINNVEVGTLDLTSGNSNITVNNNYQPGTYTVRVDYNDNTGVYTSNTNSTTLYVRSTTTIETNVLNNTIRNTTFTVSLIDARGNTFDGPVNITLPDGTKRENVAVTNGIASITLDNLAVGTNTFTIEYPGNTIYDASIATLNIDVVKLNSTTSATVTNTSVRNTTITVTVADEKTGTRVTSGTVEIINTDNNAVVGRGTLDNTGTITITTTLSIQDDYNLRVDYKGNNQYNTSSTLLDTITVTGRTSETLVRVNNYTFGNTSITVTVKDPITDTVINNAPITITLPNGDRINSNTGSTGTVNVDLNLPVGTNTVSVEFSGNNEYNSSTNTQNIEVQQRESLTTATVTNSSVRNTTINVTVTDKTTGAPVTSGTINIIDTNTGNTVGTGTLNGNNNILITTNIKDQGAYDLRVEYNGNTNYTGSSYNLDDITVTGRTSDITHTVNNQTTGNISISITVKDPITDTPIPNAPITITYPDGTTETTNTDPNGNYEINKDLPVGENTITVQYPGSSEYNSTLETITLTVTKRESLTTATVTNNTIRNTTITVTVTDKTTGAPVTSGEIEIINMANNEIIGRGILNGNNTLNILTNIVTSGTYNLQVNYKGNTNYTSSQDTINNLKIEKRESTIIINTVNDTIDDTRINITVKDPVTGEVITNAPIIITLPDGTTINTHTGTTGTITQTLTLSAGDNTITVTYDGNNQYNTTTTTHTIYVQKLTSTITVNKQTGYIGENITLTATITDAHGNRLNGGRVAFKLNDVTLKYDNGEVIYATVENGIASISYHIPDNYQAKSYKLSAVYGGNDEYLSSRSNTPLLNLKQRQATLTLTTSRDVKVGENLTFHVTITDKRDTQRQVNGYLIFKIDGLTIKDENNEEIRIPIIDNTADFNYTIGNQYSIRQHSITVLLGNNTYVRSQANNTFNVTETSTTINVAPLTMTHNTQTRLTGTITDTQGNNIVGTNKVAVKIDGTTIKTSTGEPQYYYVEDGQIDIPLEDNNYQEGEHTIEIVTGERSSYSSARTNTTLTITPNKTITKTEDTETKTATITNKEFVNIQTTQTQTNINESNKISITLTDTNNKKITSGTITWKQNEKTISTTNVNKGTAKLNTKFTKAGTYTLTATYNDNTGKYQTTEKTFPITVIDPRIQTTITSQNIKMTVGDTITYTLTTRDKYKNRIQEGTIITKINGKTITNKINNGITIIPLTITKAGTYKITNTYTGTKNYQPSTNTKTITVNKKTPKLTINKINATAGTKTNITIKITTEKGTPLDGKITIKTINNTKTINAKDGKATTTLTIPITQAQKNTTITATYHGNTYYNNKTITTTYIPAKQKSILTLGNTKSTTIGNIITVYGKLTNQEGTNLANQPITITINNKKYKTNTTKYGNYNIKITPTKTGTQKITATYQGNKYYNNSTNTSTTTINKQSTILTLGSTKNTTIGGRICIYGKLTDQKGQNLANQQVKINVNGKTYTLTTTKYGNYQINITANTEGKNNITSTYPGSNNYTKSTNKTTFTAKKINTKITLGSTKTVKLGKQMSIYGKLTDQKGQNLANQKITIKVNGKTYTTNTTKYGNYNIKITPTTVGIKTITATYAGNKNNKASTNSTTFQVVKT